MSDRIVRAQKEMDSGTWIAIAFLVVFGFTVLGGIAAISNWLDSRWEQKRVDVWRRKQSCDNEYWGGALVGAP